MALFLLEFIIINPALSTAFIKDDHFSEEFDNVTIPFNTTKFLSNTSITFTENLGQLKYDAVRFYDQGGGFWFTDNSVWFVLKKYAKPIDQESWSVPAKNKILNEKKMSKNPILSNPTYSDFYGLSMQKIEPLKYKEVVLKQEFVGANEVQPVGHKRLSWNSNFFYGNISEKWCTNVPNYAEVWYENIYDGIDLRYYSNANGLKYDFIVHPGGDQNDIRIKYEGARELKINSFGNLIIETEIENMVDSGLYIYQHYNGQQHKIDGKFTKYNDMEYGFELQEKYNKFKDLIIDPFLYATYIGGTNIDTCMAISIDLLGNAYVSGVTGSIDFPNSTGVFDRSFNGESDVMVSKLNQDGSALLYSTFIGGTNDETSLSIVIDLKGNAYISGVVESSDFPTTPFVFDSSYNGGDYDVFLCMLNHNGSVLKYSTYIGGTQTDWTQSIDIDSTGSVFVKGLTNSSDFPYTSGVFDISLSGENDIFVLKINNNGSRLIYSTFIGGSGSEAGMFGRYKGIEIDSAGNVFITGCTNSIDFPTTIGAYNTTLNGLSDIFVLKLNSNATKILYSTLIGGCEADCGSNIAIDNEGNAYIAGGTNSTDFPTTPGANDSSFNGGFSDIIIFKINSNGSTIVYSTYLGGNGDDVCSAMALDLSGSVIVTGSITSSNFPTTSNAFYSSYNGGMDCYVSRLNQDGSKLNFSTFLGGTSLTRGEAMAVDLSGNVYVTGDYWSSDFPTTPGAFDTSFGGGSDGFVVKFQLPSYFAFFIQSVSLLLNSAPIDTVYSRYDIYTLRVEFVNTMDISDLKNVSLLLGPFGEKIKLLFLPSSSKFSVINDPNKYINLNSSSNYYFHYPRWIIDFNITFNWNYPDENYNDVHANIVSNTLPLSWFNSTNIYRVENDLTFNGILSVKSKNESMLNDYDLIKGNVYLTWSNLTTIYENTTDVYPPDDEYNVVICDEDNNFWIDSTEPGESINITTLVPNNTASYFNYTINLTGIPHECDKTNNKFTIRIDADNITFSDPRPKNNVWVRLNEVLTGVTISDTGGGYVDNSSVLYSISSDNGTTWDNWKSILDLNSAQKIIVQENLTFEDGIDNLIKWCASDSVGNGPTESDSFRIYVDTKPLFFSDPIPAINQIFDRKEVQVGITIVDNTSGVNISTIKYSTSINSGEPWSSWKTIEGYSNGKIVNVKLNLTFQNGTDNRIRWRAYDIAGNGPTYSDEYPINVNIPKPPIIPEIKLVSPLNNSKITTTSVELSWEVINNYHPNIVFDIKLDTTNPPTNIYNQNLPFTALVIDDLDNGKKYYWTVIPRSNNINGSCISDVWSFTVDIPLPRAILKTPANNSEITSTLPTLVWSLDYDGTETVTYDVYFGTNKDPPLEFEKLTITYYAIDTALQDNTTYYWKVVPWVGKYEGFSSETWLFTVKLKEDEKIPKFGINLYLNPNPLEIKPGEVKFVTAIVTNLGEQKDNFTVIIGDINNTKLTTENYRQDTMEIEPGKNKEFLIMISVEDGIEPGFENITITAKSKLAEKYNLEIQDNQVLMIKILEKDNQKEKERGQPISIFYFSILFIIVILIIISVIIVILIRKKSSKKDSEIEKTQDIIHETPPDNITIPEPEPIVETVPSVPMPVPVQVQQPEDIQTTQQDEQEE
jgi:hypothetical protein